METHPDAVAPIVYITLSVNSVIVFLAVLYTQATKSTSRADIIKLYI